MFSQDFLSSGTSTGHPSENLHPTLYGKKGEAQEQAVLLDRREALWHQLSENVALGTRETLWKPVHFVVYHLLCVVTLWIFKYYTDLRRLRWRNRHVERSEQFLYLATRRTQELAQQLGHHSAINQAQALLTWLESSQEVRLALKAKPNFIQKIVIPATVAAIALGVIQIVCLVSGGVWQVLSQVHSAADLAHINSETLKQMMQPKGMMILVQVFLKLLGVFANIAYWVGTALACHSMMKDLPRLEAVKQEWLERMIPIWQQCHLPTHTLSAYTPQTKERSWWLHTLLCLPTLTLNFWMYMDYQFHVEPTRAFKASSELEHSVLDLLRPSKHRETNIAVATDEAYESSYRASAEVISDNPPPVSEVSTSSIHTARTVLPQAPKEASSHPTSAFKNLLDG